MTEKYPLLFTKQEQEPFTLFGFECGDGWYNILAAAFDAYLTLITLSLVTSPESIVTPDVPPTDVGNVHA